jgi:hypothetical protein
MVDMQIRQDGSRGGCGQWCGCYGRG